MKEESKGSLKSVFRDEWRFFITRSNGKYEIMSERSSGRADRAYIAYSQWSWRACPRFKSLKDAEAYLEANINYLL